MNLENIKFDITREFKPEEKKQYFILEVPGSGRLVIPESKIRELPTGLKRKFFMQRGISFRVLMTALNNWIREKDDDRKSDGSRADSGASEKEKLESPAKNKDPQSSREIIDSEMEDQKGSPGDLTEKKKSPLWKDLKEK